MLLERLPERPRVLTLTIRNGATERLAVATEAEMQNASRGTRSGNRTDEGARGGMVDPRSLWAGRNVLPAPNWDIGDDEGT